MPKQKPFCEIHVDADGVLCDWHLAAAQSWHGFTNYPTVAALAEALDECWASGADFAEIVGVPEHDLWETINTADWWASIPMMTTRFPDLPHPAVLIESLAPFAEHVLVSTAAPSFQWHDHSLKANCFAGKAEWLHRTFGSKSPRFILHSDMSVKKAHLYGDRDLLIDDSMGNCTCAEINGGTAFHYVSRKEKEGDADHRLTLLDFLKKNA